MEMSDEERVMLLQRATTDVNSALESLLNRGEGDSKTAWNGVVRIDPTLLYSGLKNNDGSITYAPYVADDPVYRYSVTLHELLHTYSVGLTRINIQEHKIYEEGVVESLLRLLRPEVLKVIGVDSGIDFSTRDGNHPFNIYLRQLEEMRGKIGMEPLFFHKQLLNTPLPERKAKVAIWLLSSR